MTLPNHNNQFIYTKKKHMGLRNDEVQTLLRKYFTNYKNIAKLKKKHKNITDKNMKKKFH